jgi:hypothetical protein
MVTSTRNPFEALIVSSFGFYACMTLALFNQLATATIRAFPVPFGHVFLAAAALSCAVVLVGFARANTATGLLIERAGLIGLAGVTASYAAWGIGTSGLRGSAFAVQMMAVAAASFLRSRQINAAKRTARRIREVR